MRGGWGGEGGETYIPAKPNMLPEVYHASSQHWNLLGRWYGAAEGQAILRLWWLTALKYLHDTSFVYKAVKAQ